MKEITTEELLKEIEENHNNSLFEEIFKRRDKELYRTALFYKGTKIMLLNMLKLLRLMVLKREMKYLYVWLILLNLFIYLEVLV